MGIDFLTRYDDSLLEVNRTLMMNLKDAGKKVMTFRGECEWLDIGRPDDYEQAVTEFERSREKYLKNNHK